MPHGRPFPGPHALPFPVPGSEAMMEVDTEGLGHRVVAAARSAARVVLCAR
ncbi:hypothetical protein [Cellulomonas sp. NS3]|uniref:hypothetical protein n=1 Tax=Cellulomonas sp. NS3 TaxID=2973977 RepID=UPI0021635A68|nr:hypothetical protein [Cellulomonas sp. NS3]